MPSKKKSAKKNKSDPRADSRMGVLAQVMLELQTVWIFFTRLPWPGNLFLTSTKPLPKLAHATRAFPFAGVVVGAIGGLVLFIGAKSGLHPLAASILAIGASALVSGAIHEDGLADVADGFGGGSTKAKKLEIMKDSRVGTYEIGRAHV